RRRATASASDAAVIASQPIALMRRRSAAWIDGSSSARRTFFAIDTVGYRSTRPALERADLLRNPQQRSRKRLKTAQIRAPPGLALFAPARRNRLMRYVAWGGARGAGVSAFGYEPSTFTDSQAARTSARAAATCSSRS